MVVGHVDLMGVWNDGSWLEIRGWLIIIIVELIDRRSWDEIGKVVIIVFVGTRQGVFWFVNKGRRVISKVCCGSSLVMSCWFCVFFDSAKTGWVEVGADGDGTSEGFGVKQRAELKSSSK